MSLNEILHYFDYKLFYSKVSVFHIKFCFSKKRSIFVRKSSNPCVGAAFGFACALCVRLGVGVHILRMACIGGVWLKRSGKKMAEEVKEFLNKFKIGHLYTRFEGMYLEICLLIIKWLSFGNMTILYNIPFVYKKNAGNSILHLQRIYTV